MKGVFMSKYKVDICGINTSNLRVLSNDENLALFKKMHDGNKLAREDLINGNLKLVLSILKKFNNKVDNLDDLFQVGCLGLVKAIDNFDTSYNVTLSTYACPLIIGEMKRYIRDNISLRISRSVKDLAYKIIKLTEELTVQNGRTPSPKELADILHVGEFDIANALNSVKEPVSMYEPIYNDGGDTIYLFDQIANKEDEYGLESRLALDKAINNLKEREINILKERFIIGKTQMEIAEELGISQAQISRIEKNAIKTLKKYVK
jgi:RNA polymerase sporulation-specific sigma factor